MTNNDERERAGRAAELARLAAAEADLTPEQFFAVAEVVRLTVSHLAELDTDPATWNFELVRAEVDTVKHGADVMWWFINNQPNGTGADK